MKNKNLILIVIGIIMLITYACKKEVSLIGNYPTVTTGEVANITQISAICYFNVQPDYYLHTSSQGVCWSTHPIPTICDFKTPDDNSYYNYAYLTELIPNTKYYVRAYAINTMGTGYGNEVSFTTGCHENPVIFNPTATYGTMTDYDGNVYKTITIGTQTWMAENLKVTHYRNGDLIPRLACENFVTQTSGSYVYLDSICHGVVGNLYSWYAATDNRNIAPAGWHLPSNSEWTTLLNYLGGSYYAGPKMMEVGTDHWIDGGGTNTSGFTALPGGILSLNFDNNGGYWWSSTYLTGEAYYIDISQSYAYVGYSYYYQYNFLPIRCIKD